MDLDIGVYHTFGMSETLSHFAVRRLSGPMRSSAYHLLDGWEIRQDRMGQLEVRESSVKEWLTTRDEVELLDEIMAVPGVSEKVAVALHSKLKD